MNPTYWFFLTLAKLISRSCFSLRILGQEHMPGPGGQLLAMNHQSYLDPPAAALAAPFPIHFLARKTLLQWPVLGRFFPDLNVVPVDQERPDMSALKNIIRLVRSGETAIVFPEGARTPDGALQPAQPGLGLIIAKNTKRIRLAPITLKIGPPVRFTAQEASTEEGHARDVYRQLSEKVMAAIAAIELTAEEKRSGF